MEFRKFLESVEDWQQFSDEVFADDRRMAADFQCWCRNHGVMPDDFDRAGIEWLHKDWSKSKRKGRWCDVWDRKRRKDFGPGRFWAPSPAGTYLNKNFVQGWRGVNPRRPGGEVS